MQVSGTIIFLIRQAFLHFFKPCLQKHARLLCVSVLYVLAYNGYSQALIKEFHKDSLHHYLYQTGMLQHKTLPAEYDSIIRIALLYYPELEKVHIRFRIKKQTSPLMARPALFSFFRKAAKRRYIVNISNETKMQLTPILLKNLSLNSRIGVIGHELSHISDYNTRYGLYFVKLLFMHLNKKTMDRFEYATDMRCIAHGLGYQLLSWSREVRGKLDLMQWRGVRNMNDGPRERYMNPGSIIKAMALHPVYY